MNNPGKALSMKDINRITLWIDANSNELGAYRDEKKQRAGEVAWPTIDMDPNNPTGVERDMDKPHCQPSNRSSNASEVPATHHGWLEISRRADLHGT